MKTGLVLEGGGMRGFFTMGVLDWMMEKEIWADYLVGVSAGASHAVSYISRQQGRSLRIAEQYLHDPRYLGLRSLIKTGSMFGMSFIYEEIPKNLDPFDYATFFAMPEQLQIGATDLLTGRIIYFDKDALRRDNRALMASSSIPCFAPVMEYAGRRLLDGGVADPIPVARARADGCDRLVVVLTRPRSYQKKREAMRPFYRAQYRAYPAFVEAMDRRHERYNQSLALVRELERTGEAVVLSPREGLKIGRFERDLQRLRGLYREGTHAAVAALPALHELGLVPAQV